MINLCAGVIKEKGEDLGKGRERHFIKIQSSSKKLFLLTKAKWMDGWLAGWLDG